MQNLRRRGCVAWSTFSLAEPFRIAHFFASGALAGTRVRQGGFPQRLSSRTSELGKSLGQGAAEVLLVARLLEGGLRRHLPGQDVTLERHVHRLHPLRLPRL